MSCGRCVFQQSSKQFHFLFPGKPSKDPSIDRDRYENVMTASVGGSLKIFCGPKEAIEKWSPNEYIWTKNGQPIDRQNGRYRIKKFDFLKIKIVTLNDDGMYNCTIRTPEGQDSISVKVVVYSNGK